MTSEQLLQSLLEKAETFRVLMVEHALPHVRQDLFMEQLRELEGALAAAQRQLARLECADTIVLGHAFRDLEASDWEGLAGAPEGSMIAESRDDAILVLSPDGDELREYRVVDDETQEITWRRETHDNWDTDFENK